jgi:trimeric autotransporter adhesin
MQKRVPQTLSAPDLRWLGLIAVAVLAALSAAGQTVGGNGIGGAPRSPGDGGPAVDAALSPDGIAVDSEGNVLIADCGGVSISDYRGNRIRRVAKETGIISTVADAVFSGPCPSYTLEASLAVDAAGNIFVTNASVGRIYRIEAGSGVVSRFAGAYPGPGLSLFSGDGGPASAALLSDPTGVAVDSIGNLYVADWFNHRVRMIEGTTGIITTVAGNGSAEIYGDGGLATNAGLLRPSGVAVDSARNLYVVEWADNSVRSLRRIDHETGIITTVMRCRRDVWDGVPAAMACLGDSCGVAVDLAGNIYIVNMYESTIRMIAEGTGIIATIAGVKGDVPRRGFSGDGGPATAALLNQPHAVAIDREGNVFIADTGNHRVRKVDAKTRIITTFAGNGQPSTAGIQNPAVAP